MPINSVCPWSGDAVSPDCITHYRGHEVAFCNPACRDKFERATKAFDSTIEAPRSMAEPLAWREGVDTYTPRRFRDGGLVALGTSRFKFYLIDSAGDASDADAMEAAVRDYARACPHVWTIDDSALGHIIVHRGEEALWLLVQWWVGGGILRGLLAKSELGQTRFVPADSSLIGCVWELQVVEHERTAWVRHMMSAAPDMDAFLSDRLASGNY